MLACPGSPGGQALWSQRKRGVFGKGTFLSMLSREKGGATVSGFDTGSEYMPTACANVAKCTDSY